MGVAQVAGSLRRVANGLAVVDWESLRSSLSSVPSLFLETFPHFDAQRLVALIENEGARAWQPPAVGGGGVGEPASEPAGKKPVADRKRSTAKGDAREKIRSGLLEHHGFSNGVVGKWEPIQVNEFAGKIGVSSSRVSNFIREGDWWRDHAAYSAACNRGDPRVAVWLALVSGEMPDWNTYGRNPPGESSEPDDE
jgi:hypothetical protein